MYFFLCWFGEPGLEFFDACFGYGVDFSGGSIGVVFYLFGYEFVFFEVFEGGVDLSVA